MLVNRRILVLTLSLNLVLIWSFETHSSGSFQININDILDERLMPVRIFAQPLRVFQKYPRENYKSAVDNISNCSDFCAALSTMKFHRQMMNEYLASKFLARQILGTSEGVQRRIGKFQMNNFEDTDNLAKSHSEIEEISMQRKAKNLSKLLADEGSANYKDWLERSTLLHDIPRQFEVQNISNIAALTTHGKTKHNSRAQNHRRSTQDNSEAIDDLEEDEDIEDGDITGYAMSSSSPEMPQSRLNSPNHLYVPNNAAYINVQENDIYTPMINKNGYEAPYGSYAPPHPNVHPPPHHHSPTVSSITIQNKEVSLKDITDIALTTLAFLSFGMFILQVLMCITMGKDDASGAMMLPMEAVEDVADLPNDGTEEIRRRRRRSSGRNGDLTLMNNISRRVLYSIDAALDIPNNNGSCHFYSICEDNKFARKQSNGLKLWLPIWSLGMSWLSSRLTSDASNDNLYGYSSISKSLKAALTGFGNGNCKSLYGKNCNTNG